MYLAKLKAIIFLMLFSSPALAGNMTVWIERPTTKVLPYDPPKSRQHVELKSARNEYESFQVVIRAQNGNLSNVDVHTTRLVGKNGNIINEDNIRLFREYYVLVTDPSLFGTHGNERLVGEYPDPLIPFKDPYDPAHPRVGSPFTVPSGRNQPVFVEVYIPEDTPAGIYKGYVYVAASGEPDVEIPVTLEVWGFSIPRERTVTTAYGFSWNEILKYHCGIDGNRDECFWRVLKNYEELFHEHRIDLQGLAQGITSPTFTFDKDGNLNPVDWTFYDASLKPRLNGSYYADGIGAKRFRDNFFAPGEGHGGFTDEEYTKIAKEYARHLKEKGWFDRPYIYVHDEPSYWEGKEGGVFTAVVHDVSLMKEGDPEWDGHFMATNHIVPELDGSIDIWCPLTINYDDWFWKKGYATREEYRKRVSKGEKLWFYVCNATFPPYAGYDLDTRIGFEPRIVHWGAWYEGGSGFLYWNTNYWKDPRPWEDLIDRDEFGPVARNGDGFLIYPGDHNGKLSPNGSPVDISLDGPIPSFRLKMIRDGLQDWEYFILLSNMGEEEYAKREVSRAYRQFGIYSGDYNPSDPPWTHDEEVLYSVRENIARRITLKFKERGCSCRVTPDARRGGTEDFIGIFFPLLISAIAIRFMIPRK